MSPDSKCELVKLKQEEKKGHQQEKLWTRDTSPLPVLPLLTRTRLLLSMLPDITISYRSMATQERPMLLCGTLRSLLLGSISSYGCLGICLDRHQKVVCKC